MIRRAVIAAAACGAALAGSAAAQPAPSPEPAPAAGPTVIVLRLDRGPGVDAALSERLQKEIEDQARRAGLQVTAGTENLADTAAVAGCSAKVITDCRDPIIDTLGVDELVYGSVERSMSGPHVTVARARKGALPAKISVDVPDGDVEGAAKALRPSLETLFPVTGTGPETGAGTGTGTGTGTAIGTGTGIYNGTGNGTGSGAGSGAAGMMGAEGQGTSARTKKVLFISGVSVGAAMFVTGMFCWFKTSSLNGDIDDAPRDTIDDINQLRDMEESAASYARWGNVLVVLGLAVGGGTAAWWYYKGRKDGPAPVPASARIDPWLAPGGGGVTLTWSTP